MCVSALEAKGEKPTDTDVFDICLIVGKIFE
jgi:hypothetical protein